MEQSFHLQHKTSILNFLSHLSAEMLDSDVWELQISVH